MAGRCGVRRPVADRQDDARSNPASYVGAFDEIRKLFAAGAAGARLWRRHVQLQRRRRALPHLRRLGLRACGDAVPCQRRLPALPGLRRQALPAEILDVKIDRRVPGDARSATSASPTCWSSPSARRCSCSDRRPRGAAAAAHRRRRPGVREAGPTRADALGRRGATPEAGWLPRRGAGCAGATGGEEGTLCSSSTSPPPACISTTSPS